MNIKDLRIQLSKFVDKHGPLAVEEQCSGRQTALEMPRTAKFVMKAIESTQTDGSMAQLALRTCALMLKGNLAPAGNFHLCLMFGPLIFESGVPDQGFDEPEGTYCPFFYRNKYNQKLEYKRKPITIKQRPVLACVKRVYGGAFSGYPKSTCSRQAKVIELLVEEANRYARIRDSKRVEAKWKSRNKAADRITSALKNYLDNEVNKHLDRISRVIVEKQTIRGWNMFTNSCQWLVMRLLSGKDFEYIIPRLPGSIGEIRDETAEEASFTWPRYLVSFGPNIEGFNQSFYQPDSMITDFAQSRPSIDYDLIEYIELCLRREQGNVPTFRRQLSLCGNNNAAVPMDALWAMPGDTLSMLQFHLLRQPSKYRDRTTGACLSEADWNKNRFLVMHLLDTFASLAGALGASLFGLLSRDRRLLSQVTIPSARVFGNILASERVRIIRCSSRWVAYDITNRVPSAMGEARERRRQLQKAAGAPGDPVHGEEVLSTMVWFFLAPLGKQTAEDLGQIFRFHHNGPWITLNGFGHTLVCPLFLKKVKNVRH
ncbi:Non-canonical purine NTP pyrophosphatase [Madurella mycetomatis]|uniref:Non-canonical purine NTP pyrophosphatase n=1 Tax=Madurella mycetomatis TaxID=100816 RepID=A0A175WG32_9PEZI|nr:Non-canonical purine NTP pyrophosphatase [Madurella mycetomatis]